MPNGKALIRGEYQDLYPGDTIKISYEGVEYVAVVETRALGCAVARVVVE